MPGQHAKLSPSAAERWLSCPASVRMEQLFAKDGDDSSPYAAEGTAAHALSELQMRFSLRRVKADEFAQELRAWRQEFGIDEDTEEEMTEYALQYVRFIRERMERYPHSSVMLEQRVDTGVPKCWGTGDAVIVSPQHVEVIDLKYGQGVKVEAEGNPQLRLYGLGALDSFADMLGETEMVFVTVFQPRLNHFATEAITPADLRAWRAGRVIPLAQEALSGDARFGPSDEACRWCPARGQCRAQHEWATQRDFGEVKPDLLDADELGEALAELPVLRQWINSLEEVALHRAYSNGESIPGYKVVKSGSRRYVADPEGAQIALSQVGYDADDVAPRKMKGIGDLEKLLGKQDFALLGAYIQKTEGKPSLVVESDKRPPINPEHDAAQEFKEEPE